MTTSNTFSSSDTAALERETELTDEPTVTQEQMWNDKHQKTAVDWIRQNAYQRVCLQFPDAYLPHSNAICDKLKQVLPGINFFILADTSYGSCCVDEIAAAHIDSDSLIHFGNACRSKVSRLPVLYMFPELPIDLQQLFEKMSMLKDNSKDKVLIVYLDIGYHHLLENDLTDMETASLKNLKETLQCKDVHIVAYPAVEEKDQILCNDEQICVFVGEDNSRFFNLSLTKKAQQWFIFNPLTNTLNEKNPLTANYIRRRYYYIEKCKDAQTLGLVVGTLTASGYLDVISRLQEMAKSRGVKTQLISVGRINPAKLANFLEIDCFVLIGCPFNNIYNSKEFYKPVVSVFEAEMALNPAWHMKYPEAYVTDFTELLPEGSNFIAFNKENIARQDVSLVSGRLRHATIDDSVELANTNALSAQQQALVTQGKMEVMTTNVGLTYEDRTWKGLEPALGCTEPAKLQKGLSGIPIKYTHD
ncbi:2-(3-amino-3-carboxypropyl)histidine synthase subunit 2 isoform X2 [Teleopsis dalmanni]|uniref:2-(3-amino-3-carboxypropyl)histidine synthase subunit 2 isoform X2 n=1 Tax=Teleopsis dalmanni TaxID=139649 RepID=UPI0018CF43AC|nr:2-(3-amino-3-carboxypropyl)histidine synthase subunit 2 isoform X2 [Teleopsis dalmanni]